MGIVSNEIAANDVTKLNRAGAISDFGPTSIVVARSTVISRRVAFLLQPADNRRRIHDRILALAVEHPSRRLAARGRKWRNVEKCLKSRG